MITDRIHILVQVGSGGNGCESFFRRTDKKIIPNGGDGGNGGGVIFRADVNTQSLESFRYRQHLIAESGGNGGSNRKRGRNGQDLVVSVPLGTKLFDREKKLLIRELKKEGDEVVVLPGGRGGGGNIGGKQSHPGEKGKTIDLELSFRILADIFFVGIPNSGKSALLNRLTRTHVAETEYPFSTQSPEIGVCLISDYERLTLCELPSLYGSSHEGRGRGADFLKHLENAKMIIFILDPVSKFSNTLTEALAILRKEIETFHAEYLSIPYAVIVNKMDLPEAQEKVKKEIFKPGGPCFFISAKTGDGLQGFLDFLKEKGESFSHA